MYCDVDVSAIARRHGGNGHTAAAGFSVQLDPEDPGTQLNPYRMAERLL
jgi:nanoRNase/pAp phosphatase (c-di-AMP/oligoRNAs hydrolase)